MKRSLWLACVIWLGCGDGLEGVGGGPTLEDTSPRARAVEQLERATGAPITLAVGARGTTRTLAMAPAHHLRTSVADPADAARQFLADYHDAFLLATDELASFDVSRVDVEPSGSRHVTLQRSYAGVPVFHGVITVHFDASNRVFRALGDDAYRIAPPSNAQVLTSTDATTAAGRAVGAAAFEAIDVSRQMFLVSRDDTRFAYRVTLSWLDGTVRRDHLVIVDAETGAALADYDLVDAFTGRVYTASPGAAPTTDARTVVSFDGDLSASPNGWVGSARTTAGNNAVAATDLDHNNSIGSSEVQPVADALDAFDFPFSPADDPALHRDAAVTNAFYLVNAWHDRTYKLGFTESAGNFQASNLGKGGAQNDEVQIDVQDGAGVDNATFATPPDGSRPRLQLYLFDLVNGSTGVLVDSAFDPSVIFHEQTHGLSNRLVGGGTTGCLPGLQSGGMGEGWADFMAASFLDDPVIGAYVTGNAEVGIRRASMASSSFTYDNIKDRSLSEIHDVGEIWAATLWDIRTVLGAAITEQLVVSAMKLTPCRPTMLDARDAIIAADATINAGANRCVLYTAFAGRMMGTGAASATDDSTTSIVTSDEVPADCIPPTKTFTAADVPLAIPDNSSIGATSVIHARPKGYVAQKILVSASITHPYRGDLVIQVIAPDGQVATLSDRAGGSADDFAVTNLDITSSFTPGTRASGTWKLFVRDVAIADVGQITAFSLTITASRAVP